MYDTDSLSERILGIIRLLSEQIGPRPSGSKQEAASQTVHGRSPVVSGVRDRQPAFFHIPKSPLFTLI